MALNPTRTRPHAPRYLGALATLLAVCLPACGGDEPAGESEPGPVAEPTEPAEPEGGSETTATPPRSSGSQGRRRFDIQPAVTPAPEGTAADAPATLRGVAMLTGKIPKRQVIAMDHIGGCREHGNGLSEGVIAKETGELQNVVVYITRGIDSDTIPPAPEEAVELAQEGCTFKPHISVVRAGQTLKISNEDKTAHNVNARPAHGSNQAFNKTQPKNAGDLEVSFARAEVAIPIGCDIHPWMKAWVAVVDHPHYSLTGEDGVWSIELPPGDYLVEAWHERYGTLKGTVEVGPGETAEFPFTYESGKQRR